MHYGVIDHLKIQFWIAYFLQVFSTSKNPAGVKFLKIINNRFQTVWNPWWLNKHSQNSHRVYFSMYFIASWKIKKLNMKILGLKILFKGCFQQVRVEGWIDRWTILFVPWNPPRNRRSKLSRDSSIVMTDVVDNLCWRPSMLAIVFYIVKVTILLILSTKFQNFHHQNVSIINVTFDSTHIKSLDFQIRSSLARKILTESGISE